MKSSFFMRRADALTLTWLVCLTVCDGAMVLWKWWWLMPIAMVFCVSACAAKHNHTHCATFGPRWLNRLMDFWLTLLTGTSTSGIRVAHQVLHHGNNQSPDDFVRCSLVAHLPPGLALLQYVPLVVKEVWKKRGPQHVSQRCTALQRDCLIERIFLWLFLGYIVFSHGWMALLMLGIPWLFGQWFLIAMNLPQHDGCDAESAWAHSRNVTGWLANGLFLNNGYHTAHHEWPSRHWSELRELHEQRVAREIPAHLASETLAGFWMAWWRARRKGGIA